MKRTILAVILVAFCSGQVFSQKIKGKDEEAVKIGEIPAVITKIPKDQKFKMILGGTLGYLNPKEFYMPNWLPGMDAKIERSADKETDYTFEFATEAMTPIEVSALKSYKGGSIKGQVVEVKYTMPRQIRIKDKSGNILQTWVVNGNEEKVAIVHPNFTAPAQKSPMYPSAVNPVEVGYIISEKYTVENFEADFEKNKDKIFSRIEFNEVDDLVSDNNLKYLEYAYSKIKTGNPKVMTIEKKHKADYSELDAKIESFIQLINKIYAGEFDQSAKKEAVVFGDYFSSKYTEDSDKELKKICGFNASLAYGIGNEAVKSNEQYNNIKNSFGLFGGPTTGLEKNVEKFLCLNQLYDAKENKNIELKPVLSFSEIERLQKTAENDKLRAEAVAKYAASVKYNLKDKEGFIIDKNGDKVEGTVKELTLVEPGSGGILNLDLGKVCTFIYADGKGKFLRPGDVKSISAGGYIYEPIKEKENTGMKILAVAVSGKIGGTVFLPLIYQKGDYKVFLSPEYDYYLIKKDGEEFAYALYNLIAKGKVSESFIGECEVLTNKIEAKEINNDKDGAIIFVDTLAECNK